jgi:two-component system sensor histidine kinase KdpD
VLGSIVAALQLDGAALIAPIGGCDTTLARSGSTGRPVHAIELRAAADGTARSLQVTGRALSADDRRVLLAVGDQLVTALDAQSARTEARRSQELSAIDLARTALLRAVGHDLRTPLATIKAMVSGLLDPAVPWKAEQIREAHEVIDQEADRLDRLIGNLLDAGRLETGTLAVFLDAVDMDDVIAGALQALSGPIPQVDVRLAADLPGVLADRSLLERVMANLVENARRYSPPGMPIAITADQVGDEVHVCVVDRGPGIPASRRSDVTAPFQRLDDHGAEGVGLGLSIVEGFVHAMGGRVVLDDTPGGGLTVTLARRRAPDEAGRS